jgi:STE24 endopeptidase
MSYGSYIALMDQVESFLLLSSTALPLASLLFSVGKGASEQATLLSWFWDFAAKVPGGGSTEIRHSMAFVFVLTTLGTFISAPKAYYKNFVLEEAHGFNKTSRSTFVADQIKGEQHLRRS